MTSPHSTITEFDELLNKDWYTYLTQPQKLLIDVAVRLYEREEQAAQEFSDYSFIVFSAAKAYEGFIKKYLYDINLIPQDVYEGHRFRIGRAINPDVSERHRDEYWLFDDIAHQCGKIIARQMWDTWLQCRNQVFHYFPKNEKHLSLSEAKEYLLLLMNTMDLAVGCKHQELEFEQRNN